MLHVPAISAPTVTAPELHRILSQPEFLEGDLSELPRETWLSRLIEQLGRWQEALGWGTGGWPGVVGSLLLLMVLLFTAVRLSWQFFSRRARHEREPGAGVAEGRSADEMLAAATAAARSGDFREAIRFSFLALLRRLELPTTALMTNRQLLQRITQHHPHAQSAFSAVVLSYEDAWYGALPCNAEEYMRVSELARSVELDDSESLREQTTL